MTACPQAPFLLLTAIISLLCTGVEFFCVVFVSGVQDLDSVPPRVSLVLQRFFFLHDDYKGVLNFSPGIQYVCVAYLFEIYSSVDVYSSLFIAPCALIFSF